MSAKEIQNVFRFCRLLQKAKQAPASAPVPRYTNFTLQHAWEKFDCQTQLLQREALVPLMKKNPELLDPDGNHISIHTMKARHFTSTVAQSSKV